MAQSTAHLDDDHSELDRDALGDGRFTDAGKSLGMEATRRNLDVVTAVKEMSE